MSYNEHTLKENILHGDSMLQLNVYHNQIINHSLDLYLHWHEEIEIIYVEKGSFILTVNGQNYHAKEDEIYFINKQALHSAHCIDQKESLRFAVVFNLDFLCSLHFDSCQLKFLDPLQKGTMIFPICIKGDLPIGNQIKSALFQIRELHVSQLYGYELGIKANLFQILSSLLIQHHLISLNNATCETQSSKLILVKRALDYLHDHYDEKIHMVELASSLNISHEYLSRIFKSYVGKTPVEYLIYYRLNKASKLLLTTDQTIIEIALQCGFDNISYFIKKFKQYIGLTPKQYQKSFTQQEHIAL